MSTEPRTLSEAILHFSDPEAALATMVELQPNGVTCPGCGRPNARFIATRRIWEMQRAIMHFAARS